MLINVMYHHVNSDRCSNKLEIFEKHLEYVSKNFISVFPSDNIPSNAICLTFDDAYADFYFLIFPLLKKYNLRALLAVPTKYILDNCSVEKELRMSFEHNDEFENYKRGTFCTFSEMKEMVDSKLVQIVSHSHTHSNLVEDEINLSDEIILSKQILESKLNIKVDSFIFPFGKYNEKIAEETFKYYKYVFRIGNAVHKNFEGIKGINYRIDGDGLKSENEIFSFFKMFSFKIKAIIKTFKN